jgi:hypothetical protein
MHLAGSLRVGAPQPERVNMGDVLVRELIRAGANPLQQNRLARRRLDEASSLTSRNGAALDVLWQGTAEAEM